MSWQFSLASSSFSRSSSSSRTLLPSSSVIFQEDSPDDIGSCENLLRTLIDEKVRGPYLFRLRDEFDTLEAAGQSDVLKPKDKIADSIERARKVIKLDSHIISVVIKRHRPRIDSETQLGRHFLAARREVLALSHKRLLGHPNIVQLQAWGLCLDTIEEPQKTSLQVPLLVLERAESDLEQLLQSLARNSEPKSYNLRIRLCRDIGNGLKILHQSGFTHGDLKPKNILVFRASRQWKAKLCDFGCAQQQAASEPPVNTIQDGEAEISSHGAGIYLGTANWLPPEVATRSVQTFDHETLQRCDIFVYGMVVWSTLYHHGKPCTFNDLMEPMQTQNQAIQEIMSLRLSSYLLSAIQKLIQGCICLPHERSLSPWDNLRQGPVSSAVRNKIKGVANALFDQCLFPAARMVQNIPTTPYSFPRINSLSRWPGEPNVCRPLDPEEKKLYEDQAWWNRQQSSTYGTILLSENPQVLRRPEDGDSRNLSTFHEPRGKLEIEAAYTAIVSSFGRSTALQATRLYCCARFRSRVSLKEWKGLQQRNNLVDLALRSRPLPEISTMAWLCRGEVGLHEVKNLPRTFETWDAILDPNLLNESERLERFLLLLQSGAEIQELMPPSPTWTDNKRRSILFEYIRTCRRVVVSMAMKEILSQFKSIQNQTQISKATKAYLTGQHHSSSTALGEFVDSINYEAVVELHSEVNGQLLEHIAERGLGSPLFIQENARDYRLAHRRDAQQILNLICRPKLKMPRQVQPQSFSKSLGRISEDTERGNQDHATQEENGLVAGWEVVKVDSGNGRLLFYRDLVTQSITLREPCVNLLTGSQVQIGYQDGRGTPFYLRDISFFFRSEFNAEAFNKRFPIYSEEWFKGEHNLSAPTTDILGALVDPWRIPSLNETVDITWLSYFLSMWRKVFSISWITLIMYGLRLIPLVALLAHKAK